MPRRHYPFARGVRKRQPLTRRKLQAALVTYVTAGFPTAEATPNVLVSMEKGGADIIELGVPFTDPIADGPTIQTANTVSALD